MKKHLALMFCLLLAGCSDADWNHALNYSGLGSNPDADADAVQPVTSAATAAPSGAPTQAAAPNADLCRAVATQDATGNDFDPATQQRVFARSYSQCVTVYTR
jgi:Tfp pilus assembly protein PilP